MSTSPKIRVAVVGGGPGGVVAALALAKNEKLDVTLYEAAAHFGEIGLSLGMPWRSWTILRLLGQQQYLTPLLKEIPKDEWVPTVRYRKSDQPEGEDIFMCMSKIGYVRFRRSHFHAALLKELPEGTHTATGKRLVSYVETSNPADPIELRFQDGTTATTDIIVGADGIKSAVRGSMYSTAAEEAEKEGKTEEAAKLRNLIRAKFSGVEVFRSVISAEKLRELSPNHPAFETPTQFLGKEKHIMNYPINSEHDRVLNVGVYLCDYTREGEDYPEPWVTDTTSEHLASLYPNWEPDAQALFKCIPPTVSRWAINTVSNLPFFNKSRAVLLGDAHAMTNFQGAGAGQAIEDAYILSSILSHPAVNKDNVTKALEIYSEVRIPFSRHVLESSRRTGIDCALHDDVAASDLKSLGKRMQEEMDWAWTWRPEDEQKKALDLVEKVLGN